MNPIKTTLISCSLMILGMMSFQAQAQTENADKEENKKKSHLISTNSGIEGFNLQFATVNQNGVTLNTSPRFSYYFNMGFDVNVKLNHYVRPFTGVYLKNIGVITHSGNTTLKRRIYSLGFPIGLKIYSKNKKTVGKLGADFNYALNYKEKTFVDGKKQSKFNEWNSERTPSWYPSLFAGLKYYGMSVTANYYYQNFFNKDYKNDQGLMPYANTNTDLVTISFGYSFDGGNKAGKALKQKLKKQKAETTTSL